VFVSKLLEAGHDPMAVRLALLAHHYRTDWDWTDAGLAAASEQLATWRRAAAAAGSTGSGGFSGSGGSAGPGGSVGDEILAGVRDRIADDLDAPGALTVVDEWAARALSGAAAGSGPLVTATVDAVLGIAL
jgi:L-cysteine:1D-myo-inositol 2-amino-2-deoxy-alpha-D-glucopyranoside ligase